MVSDGGYVILIVVSMHVFLTTKEVAGLVSGLIEREGTWRVPGETTCGAHVPN